ncbi:hypothetical protein [Sulfuriflexus mobilis]|uniref:hypothetical protein n=1 Tax=Sulfuriflexus mobilis TaxID=1811807 RepID=UPI000F839E17|nr:hypothetical protein [Sulfuriflexus mobilis]
MIYAEIENNDSYYDFYPELLAYIKKCFQDVESGLQGDAWIWIKCNNEKVALDTFTSMRFQIKTDIKNGALVKEVIDTLKKRYSVHVFDEPEPEAHE